MKYLLIFILVLFSLLYSRCLYINFKSISDDEYKIYSEIIDEYMTGGEMKINMYTLSVKQFFDNETPTTIYESYLQNSFRNDVLKNLANEFYKKNKKKYKLKKNRFLSMRLVFLIRPYFHLNDFFHSYKRELNLSRYIYSKSIYLSRVGFCQKKKYGLVYVNDLRVYAAGTADFIILEKIKENWKIKKVENVWTY